MIFHSIDEAVEVLRDLVNLVRQEENNSVKSMVLREIGNNFADLGFLDEARELLLDAYKYAEKINDVDKMLSEILEISRDLYSMGFIDYSIKILEDTLNRSEKYIEVEDKLFIYIQIAQELIDVKFLDLAREAIERIIDLYFNMDPSDIEDIDLLIQGFKLICFFERGSIVKKIYRILIARLEEEDEKSIDEFYLDLLDTIIDLNWFAETRDIILNRIRSIENKLEAVSKLVEKISESIRKSIKNEYS